ncbi:hypothetical protein EB118_11275 [bacterium]|nr:hypothetical protein [bacterium]
MEAIEAYKIYIAIKNHFVLDNYDYFKYNKKINVSFDSFLKRKDKIFFAKLGKRKDKYLEDFLVANFLYQTNIWVGELLSDECEERYKNWKRKQESISYHFKSEMEFVSELDTDEFNKLFQTINGNHPRIIQKYLHKEISIETLCILDSILKFTHKSDKLLSDPIYTDISKLCKKYQPFLKVDIVKQRQTLKQLVQK